VCIDRLRGIQRCLRAITTVRRLLPAAHRALFGCALALQFAVLSSSVWAQQARPYLLAEPFEYTDVIDAFDGDDPIDVNVALRFARTQNDASISREASQPGDQVAGRFLPVAESRQVTNALELEVDVGVWKDLMVFTRLPLVLNDTRRLQLPSAANCDTQNCLDRQAEIAAALTPLEASGPGNPTLAIAPGSGFHSATRSGIPALDFGVAWGIVNQYRTPYLPTWVISAETRVGVGKIMSPCSDGGACDTGINRGTVRFEFASRWSYRLRFIEPYLGLSYALERATAAKERFSPHGDQRGYLDTTPPSVFEATLGAALVAWEDRGRFQRFAVDVRGSAAYVSAGRDYTPLYDALGTSANAHLQSTYTSPSGASVGFNGLTNVDSYARFGVELAAAMQAARYVRFRLGVAFSHLTQHLLTDAAPCPSGPGPACASAQINALYRPVIDLPGQRFLLSSDLTFALFAHATGQF
jgi:hypothetical protein